MSETQSETDLRRGAILAHVIRDYNQEIKNYSEWQHKDNSISSNGQLPHHVGN